MRLDRHVSAMKPTYLLSVLVLAALPACAQSAKRPNHDVTAAPVASIAEVAKNAVTAAPPHETELAKATQGWRLGQSYHYRLSMLSQVAMGAASSSDFELTGTVEVVPVEVSAQTAKLF